jgi:hypothetical protein
MKGHLPLLHHFEQRALHLGRRPVDFIRQQEVGKDRAERGVEFARLLVVDAGADQSGGNQVGCELDALKLAANRFGQGLDRHGLGQTRHAFDQDVPARQQGDDQSFQQKVLSDDDLLDFVQDAFHRLPILGIQILIHSPVSNLCLRNQVFAEQVKPGFLDTFQTTS